MPCSKYLIPRIALADLAPMLAMALVGAMLAGAYGAVHDQVTYSISGEYFTKLKFRQFWYADLGLGDRMFAATIGFLAAWWVGFVIAWFLGRRLPPGQPRRRAYRQLAIAFACVFGCGLSFGLLGFAYGLWRGAQADYSAWDWAIQECHVTDLWSFVRVAYIHNGSYLGGLAGLLIALFAIRPVRTGASDRPGEACR